MLAEQGRADTSRWSTTIASRFGGEMGKHIDGFHHRAAHHTGHRLHLCGGRSLDEVCPLLFHSNSVLGLTGGRIVFQGGVSATWSPREHHQ